MSLIRKDRATGKVISRGRIGSNTFNTAGLNEIASRVAAGGSTGAWSRDNLILTINPSSGSVQTIGRSTADVEGAIEVDGQTLKMSWTDDRGTAYTIHKTNGLDIGKGTTSSNTKIAKYADSGTDTSVDAQNQAFGGANDDAWSTNASGQPVKPATEDWIFEWIVTITPAGAGTAASAWQSDTNARRAFARRLMNVDGGGAAITNQASAWVHASGPAPHGARAGLTILGHASTAHVPWVAYDWGTVNVNPFAREAATVPRGDTLDLGIRLLAHDGDALEAEVAAHAAALAVESAAGASISRAASRP